MAFGTFSCGLFLTCGLRMARLGEEVRFYEKYEFPYVFASNLDWEEWHLLMAGQPIPTNVPPSWNKGFLTIGLPYNKALFNPYFWRGHVRGGDTFTSHNVWTFKQSGDSCFRWKKLQGLNSRKIGSLLLKEISLPNHPSQDYSDLGRGHPKGLLIATKSWVSLTFTSFNTSKHRPPDFALHLSKHRLFRPNLKRPRETKKLRSDDGCGSGNWKMGVFRSCTWKDIFVVPRWAPNRWLYMELCQTKPVYING